MRVDIQKIYDDAILPYRGSDEAAGYDLFSRENQVIQPHETVKFDTGLAFALPEDTFGAIFARSGLSIREGLRLANSVAVIDQDFRGSVVVALHNDSDKVKAVSKGDRIAQLVIIPYVPAEYFVVDELPETARGTGGLGSTGK